MIQGRMTDFWFTSFSWSALDAEFPLLLHNIYVGVVYRLQPITSCSLSTVAVQAVMNFTIVVLGLR